MLFPQLTLMSCMFAPFASVDKEHRRFIQFGLLTNIVRPMELYPLRNPSLGCGPEVHEDFPSLIRLLVHWYCFHCAQLVYSYLNGKFSTAQLCCEFNMSSKALAEILESDPFTILLKK